MGQRLVIGVRRNEDSDEKLLCALYFHWSAYPSTTIDELSKVVKGISSELNTTDFSSKTDEEIQLAMIRTIENLGGGIDGGDGSLEWHIIKEKFPNEKFKTENISRNSGLIAISEECIRRMYEMAQGTAEIYLNDNTVSTDVWWSYNNYEEFVKEEGDDIGEDKFTKVDFDLMGTLKWDSLDTIEEIIRTNHYIKFPDGSFSEFME